MGTDIYLQDTVKGKCPRFCKYLRLLKSGFVGLSNFAGRKKLPELAARDQQQQSMLILLITSIL